MRRANYVWTDEVRSVVIELSLPVVDRLSLEAMEAFKSVPRRGLEIGGVLLGSIRRARDGQTRISVEDYAEVPSEHRSGPSYQLSAADLDALDRACKTNPRAVGMYRTATKSETICLHQDDTNLFERNFSSVAAVFLLVHPATRTAAFCLKGPEGLAVAHEFPFHAAELASGSTESENADPEQPTATVGRSSSARVRVWSVRAAALLLGGALGALGWRWLQPRAPTAVPVHTAAVQPTVDTGHVGLNVSRDGRMLRLAWDHHAAAIREADHALLHILDGNHQTDLKLAPNELQDGTLSYWPDSADVTFRLEVFGAGHKTDDTVRAVNGGQASTPVTTAQTPAPDRTGDQHRWVKASRDRRSDDGDPDATAAPEAAPKPSPILATPRTDSAPLEAIDTPAPKPAATPIAATVPTHDTPPRIEVSAEPAPPSRWNRVVRHIPLLRRLKKGQQTVVPPQPVREAKPPLAAVERHKFTDEVPIDVRVYVTESGAVNYAELVDNRPAVRYPELADAAVFAARRWNFRPARIGDENVPSEVILHFRFTPGENQP
jgi:hypothetical protein